MGAGGKTSASYPTDNGLLLYFLSFFHLNFRQMGINRIKSRTVTDNHIITQPEAIKTGQKHFARAHRLDHRSQRSGQINCLMKTRIALGKSKILQRKLKRALVKTLISSGSIAKA